VFRRADGTSFPVEYSSFPIADQSGVSGAVVTFSDITERKRAEEALRQDEERFRLLTEVMPQLVWSSRPDGRVDYCNSRWLAYTGLTLAEVQDGGWTKALHPDDHAATMAAWARATQTGEEYQVEQRLRARGGQYHWFLTRALPLRDAAGKVVMWYGTCTDIDARKQAEETVRAGEARWRAILEKSFEAVLLVDGEGVIRYATPSGTAVLGYAPEEVNGRNAFELIHPEDEPRVRGLFERLVRTPGGDEAWTQRGRHRDGSDRWLESRATNLLDDPAVRAVVVNVRDITARRQAEDLLARQALILANVRDSVIVADPEGVVTYWNEGATRLFGWAPQEMVGRPVTERVPDAAREAVVARLRAVQQGAEIQGEWEDYRKDGSPIWIECRISPLRDRDGRPEGLLSLARDVSDRKRAEAERDQLLARLRMQIERMPLGYLLFDAHLRLVDWNSAAERIFGYSK